MAKEEAPPKKSRARSEAPDEEQTEEAAETNESSSSWYATALEGINKTIYKSGYYLSYGVVFPTCFIAGLVPTDNAMGRGLIDGAHAARDAVQRMRHRSEGSGDDAAEPAAA